jgi:hypothetical protein
MGTCPWGLTIRGQTFEHGWTGKGTAGGAFPLGLLVYE